MENSIPFLGHLLRHFISGSSLTNIMDKTYFVHMITPERHFRDRKKTSKGINLQSNNIAHNNHRIISDGIHHFTTISLCMPTFYYVFPQANNLFKIQCCKCESNCCCPCERRHHMGLFLFNKKRSFINS